MVPLLCVKVDRRSRPENEKYDAWGFSIYFLEHYGDQSSLMISNLQFRNEWLEKEVKEFSTRLPKYLRGEFDVFRMVLFMLSETLTKYSLKIFDVWTGSVTDLPVASWIIAILEYAKLFLEIIEVILFQIFFIFIIFVAKQILKIILFTFLQFINYTISNFSIKSFISFVARLFHFP